MGISWRRFKNGFSVDWILIGVSGKTIVIVVSVINVVQNVIEREENTCKCTEKEKWELLGFKMLSARIVKT